MSAVDRLKDKAAHAKTIASEAMKQLESDLDALIAEKANVDAKRTAALAGHIETIAGVKEQWDAMKSAIDILSNGGPGNG